jgi:hypothetical protein
LAAAAEREAKENERLAATLARMEADKRLAEQRLEQERKQKLERQR